MMMHESTCFSFLIVSSIMLFSISLHLTAFLIIPKSFSQLFTDDNKAQYAGGVAS